MQEITLPQTNNSNRSDDAPKDQKNKPRKISVVSQDENNDHGKVHNPAGSSNTDIKVNNPTVTNNTPLSSNSSSQTDQDQVTQRSSADQKQDNYVNDTNGASNIDPNDSKIDRTTQSGQSRETGFPSGFGGGSKSSPFADFSDPWGADPFSSDDRSPKGSDQKKLSPKERVKMIEEIYQQVLGRDPDTRDINYYKYSTLGPDEIKSQLLEGKEHQQLLNDGREFKKLKERAESAEVRVKALESQIKDQVEEFKYLSELLKQKNALIQELRSQMNNPYNMDTSEQKVVSQMGDDTFRQGIVQSGIDQKITDQNVASNTQQFQQLERNPTQMNETHSGSNLPQNSDPGITTLDQRQTEVHRSDQQVVLSTEENLNDPTESVQQDLDQTSNYQGSENRNNGQERSAVQTPMGGSESNQNSIKSVKEADDEQPPIDKDEVVGFFDVGLEDAFNVISRGKKEPELDFKEKQRESFKRDNIQNDNKNVPPTVGSSEPQSPIEPTLNRSDNTQVNNVNSTYPSTTSSNNGQGNQNLVFSSVDPVVQMNDKDQNKKDNPGKFGGLLGKVRDSLTP